jgi:hypothetical protein
MDILFWRNVAIVILAVEVFVCALVPLAILYILNRLVWQMRSALRALFPRTLERLQQAEWITVGVSEAVTPPIISGYALAARVRATAWSLYGMLREHTR